MMHDHEKSDLAIVASKPTNKAGKPAAEPVERRAGTEGNARQQSTRRETLRSQHDALDALVVGISSTKVNYILDADIRSFFGEVSQEWLVRFLNHRVGDPRIIRLIQKWLKAGVLEDGVVTTSEQGTGQGSVASPLLANVYLHYVFDLWAERWRRREATGAMIVVRYADDIVAGFEHEADARRFWDAMRDRLWEFSLSLHPDKTRLIEFGRHAAALVCHPHLCGILR